MLDEKYRWIAESFRDTMAGVFGGIAAVYSTQPLDTTKVKMQTFPNEYRSVIVTLSKTFKQEGIRGLYAGSIPAVLANVGESAIAFLAYGRISSIAQYLTGSKSHQELSLLSQAFCGAGSGACASFVLTPTELIKCRLQTQYITGKAAKGVPTTPFAMFMHIASKEGPLKLMRGWTPTLLRETWGYFYLFGGYEAAKRILMKDPDEISLWKTAVTGGVGGTMCWGFAYPIDVVKSQVQVGSLSPFDAMKNIYSEFGYKGFLRGITPCLMRAFPAGGALFVAVDYTKLAFDKVVFEPY